ncbi:MAG: HNH endonuclease [Sedimentisphaerales bacterium]|nr:HNH endonuclease [Sedimentisphaerales bacterium]
MTKISIKIPIPTFIERIYIFFLLRYRKKRFGLAFRKITLTNGKFTIVSPEDYEKLSEYNWQCIEKNNNSYAIRMQGNKIIQMHRMITNTPKGKVVDHKDRNGLNNIRENLRLATIAQNNRNCKKRTTPVSSKYKGVSLYKGYKKWRASIRYDNKYKHLGYFENEIEAAKAYDEAAKKYHGEFAVLNFPKNNPKAHNIKLPV